eukprot:5083137-Amphidinium_carterae.1
MESTVPKRLSPKDCDETDFWRAQSIPIIAVYLGHNPTRRALHRVERVGRYLKRTGRRVQRFERQGCVQEICLYTESKFAGCLETRKSTAMERSLYPKGQYLRPRQILHEGIRWSQSWFSTSW